MVDELDAAMADARAVVELGRRVRVQTRTRTRQPLRAAVVHASGARSGIERLAEVIADELNVRSVRLADAGERFGRWRARPDFRALGPRLGARVKELASALAEDDGELAGRLAQGAEVTVPLTDGDVRVGPDDVELVREVQEGWGVAGDGSLTVALDLDVDDDLRREGTARELIRLVQDARKAGGLEVSDRIVLGIEASGAVAEALAIHRDELAAEALAVEVIEGPLAEAGFRDEGSIDGLPVVITLRRAAR
jgi:isoleucyl-tRNA synthetase